MVDLAFPNTDTIMEDTAPSCDGPLFRYIPTEWFPNKGRFEHFAVVETVETGDFTPIIDESFVGEAIPSLELPMALHSELCDDIVEFFSMNSAEPNDTVMGI